MSFAATMRRSSPSSLNSVPAYFAYRTLSPVETSIAMRLPSLSNAPGSDGDDLALLGLLLGGVRKDDAALGHVLARDRLDDDAVTEWAQLRSGRSGSGFGQRAVPPVTARADRQAWLVGAATRRNGAWSAGPSSVASLGRVPDFSRRVVPGPRPGSVRGCISTLCVRVLMRSLPNGARPVNSSVACPRECRSYALTRPSRARPRARRGARPPTPR